MKRIIGVCGLISSGKSSFAKELSSVMNAIYIDCDKVAHIALEEKKEQIIKLFGSSILNAENKIDRKKLGFIVFSNKSKLKKLEKISHSFVNEYLKKEIENTDKNIVVEAALLFKNGTNKLCTDTIYIESRKKDIIKRLIKNRGMSLREAKKRIKIQRYVKNKKSNTDIIVINIGRLKGLLDIAKIIGRCYGQESIFRFRKKLIYRR